MSVSINSNSYSYLVSLPFGTIYKELAIISRGCGFLVKLLFQSLTGYTGWSGYKSPACRQEHKEIMKILLILLQKFASIKSCRFKQFPVPFLSIKLGQYKLSIKSRKRRSLLQKSHSLLLACYFLSL